jgi:DNA topoisomerase-1
MACSGYPDCKYTQPLEEPEAVDQKCDKCGRPMIVKHGRFGRFLACSGYPDCKNAQPFTVGVDCPEEGCRGVIVEKKSRKGKVFFGCSNYPACKFATWNKPVAKTCRQCQNYYLELRSSQAKGDYLQCPVCKSHFNIEDEESPREVAYSA